MLRPTAARADHLSVADAESLAEVMQALASPVRLRILSVLRSGPATVTALCDELGAGQTTVSNHLRLLRELGIVVGTRDGRHIRYELYDDHVVELFDEAVGHVAHLSLGT